MPSLRAAPMGFLALPGLVILVLVVIPLGMILFLSLSPPPMGEGTWPTFSNYERITSSVFARQAGFSIVLATLISAITLIFALPFAYVLTGLSRRAQSLWLVCVLAQISLSEVLIAFAWQVLLSGTTGVSNVLVWIGVTGQSVSIVPSFSALVLALTYMSLPFAVLVLYPSLSRLDRSIIEAAQTLGASGPRAFATIVVPMNRQALVTCGVTLFILNLGAIIVPQLLGRPRHWTLAVHITDQAIFQFNVPFAAALSVILLGISTIVLLVLSRLAHRGAP